MEAEGAYNTNLPIPTPLTFLQQAQSHWAALFQQPNGPRQVPDGNRPVILSVANQRLNNSWGDTLQEKQETTTRIYGLNVNGLTLDRRGGQFDLLCEVMKEVQADVLCGQEHNLDSDQTIYTKLFYTCLSYVYF
jgi:hypothetical protein